VIDLDRLHGPLAGEPIPLHGGSPTASTCGGCIDCCHLPAISLTVEEAARLEVLAITRQRVDEPLIIDLDPDRPDWRVMRGPCVFRGDDWSGPRGCSIYDDRPGSCHVFMCALRADARRKND
jgi:Fe-S-cluster containining protein